MNERTVNMKKATKWLFLIGFVTAIAAIFNKVIFTVATLKERLFNNKAHYYQWKFGKIYYTVQGHGPSVLLVHDTEADGSANEFQRIVTTLSKQYKVYTLDLLGYGRSEKPKLTYTAYVFVQLIHDFRKDIIRDHTSVITSGKSNAFVTMACYQDHEQFKNLIFINPANLQQLKVNPGNRDKFIKFILELPLIGTSIYNYKFSQKSIAKLFNLRIYNPTQIKDRFLDTNYESAHTGGSASKFVYASNRCHFNNVNITDAIAGINNNIFIIQGLRCDDDPTCKCNDYKVINPSIECATIERTKTMPHLEKPESVLEILSVYLH